MTIPLIVFLLSLIALGTTTYKAVEPYVEAEKQMKEVTTQMTTEASAIDWAHWLSINPDIVGWIVVPGTAIDYPIVQAKAADPTYYLTHDVYGNANIYGCPYIDADCKGFTDLAPIIYGHHMINQTMFSDFAKMTNSAYVEEHHLIYLHQPNKTTVIYEVAAAKVINAAVLPKVTGFTSDNAMREHMQKALETCPVKRVDITEKPGKVITFVTCSYTMWSDERTLVYAIEKGGS